jgi:lipoprotein-releasing system permease protein
MYKLLLSSRYLRTRFIALASIVSITLGVATMIVVNSVMNGFSTQMKDRIRGILADVMVDAVNMDGEPDPEGTMALIRSLAGEHIVAMTPTVEVYGLMTFEWNGENFSRLVTIIGILPDGKDAVSPLKEYMQSRKNNHRAAGDPLDWTLTSRAEEFRGRWLELERIKNEVHFAAPGSDLGGLEGDPFGGSSASPAGGPAGAPSPVDDPNAAMPARVFVGASLVSFPYRDKNGAVQTAVMVHPGQDIRLSTIKAGTPDTVGFPVTVVDVFQSGMSEYDSQIVFCNLEALQKMRGMMVQAPGLAPDWRSGSFTSIQIKLKDYALAPLVIEKLRANLPAGRFEIRTWEQKQGPLLEAVEVESAILNVLLFLIIAVAGFGILAIFYMIVIEKTRDIGILKALGASSRGVMSIFLAYGLSLGIVGAGAGVFLGLVFVRYINEIEDVLSWITGRKVFDEAVYYFKEIPTVVHPSMVLWVAGGAMAIAVLASVLPARRAALLHPVQALRYE